MVKVKVCPRCGSAEWRIKSSSTPGMGIFTMWGNSMQRDVVECSKCLYVGIFPEIEKNKLKSFQKKIKELKW